MGEGRNMSASSSRRTEALLGERRIMHIRRWDFFCFLFFFLCSRFWRSQVLGTFGNDSFPDLEMDKLQDFVPSRELGVLAPQNRAGCFIAFVHSSARLRMLYIDVGQGTVET